MIERPDRRRAALRILLVEDNEQDVFLLREAFADTAYPCDVTFVGNGAQALAYLRREEPYRNAHRPDLIVADVNMPVKNGFNLLAEVRSDAALADRPVIVLSTSASVDDVARAYRMGASAYIVKPADYADLQRIAKALCLYWGDAVRLPRWDATP